MRKIICLILFVVIAFSCGSRREDKLNPQLKAMLEDSGIKQWSRYWIGEFVYVDKDSVLHSTLNCSNYVEYPGNGHRKVVCVDTNRITSFHADSYCNTCIGDSLIEKLSRIISRNDKRLIEIFENK